MKFKNWHIYGLLAIVFGLVSAVFNFKYGANPLSSFTSITAQILFLVALVSGIISSFDDTGS